MKSHIQIPRCVLKEFVNEKNYFYKYDVLKDEITKGFPKTTYTAENYYSDAIEKALNKYVETPLKKLLNYARKFPEEEIIRVEDDLLDISRIYFKSLIARSPQLLRSVSDNGVHLQFVAPQDQHDMVVDFAMRDPRMDRFKNEYDFTFMVNKTKTPFVIPTRGAYEFSINGTQCIGVPLTPWCALLLKLKGEKLLSGKGDNVVVVISEGLDEMVTKINSFAFTKQKRDGCGYVICHDEDQLELLKKQGTCT